MPRPGPSRDDRGTVTAEAAIVMSILVLVAVGLSWLVGVASAHVRAVDAAREAARAVARGESVSAGVALGRRVAPGAAVRVLVRDGLVTSEVLVRVAGPGGLFASIASVPVHAEAVAALEPTR